MMSHPDRRPWLILSRREAIALRDMVVPAGASVQVDPRDLGRALRIIEKQLEYIDYGAGEGDHSTPEAAVERDRRAG